eukprot:TRINITY_DN11492_c6_g1_i7.p1 TRINITY_DN11492_c6_g1~~TRINITY_DN11492_c6_g1_i7.p1  ORF type:complete len:381 (+),score=61.27 TRINITY_DN11492_c6_g1_i7:147-1289(+)
MVSSSITVGLVVMAILYSLVMLVAVCSMAIGCSNDRDCSFGGRCQAGACLCNPGYTGVNCSQLDNQTIPIESGFRMADYHVWGSQVIKANATYHMFASIYNGSHDFFHNWLTDGFIVRATSSTPIGPFTYAAPVLEQVAGRWDANIMNPKLVRAIDGTYLLFYTGDANDQGKQRVGMAYSDTITGTFTRVPHPVLDVGPAGAWDSRITTNCAVTVMPNGTLYMMYKASCCQEPQKQTQVCLGAAKLDRWQDFNFTRLSNQPVLPCPTDSFSYEDPSVYYDHEHGVIHAIIKDFRGLVTHDGYSGAHFVSYDGVAYNATQPALAYGVEHLWSDGKVRTQTHQERPEILLDDNGHPLVAYFATDTELDGSQNKMWNMAMPLQ